MTNCPYNIHYKAYQSLEPCTSVYLKQKWDKTDYEKYVKRVLNTEYVIDDSPPYAYQHITQIKNKENKSKTNSKKQLIILNQYDYNLKKAVEEQYKKDQLNIMNQNLLQKLKYMARESNYGKDKLLKENKEHDRLLKSISKYPPPHTQIIKHNKKKTTKTTTTTTRNVKSTKVGSISSQKKYIKTVPKKKEPKTKGICNYSNNIIKSTNKEMKKDKKSSKKKSTIKKNIKYKIKSVDSRSGSGSYSDSDSSSSSSNYYNKNNHSRNSSYDSSSSLISNDPRYYEELNTKMELISLNGNDFPEYKQIKERFDRLYDLPPKSTLPIFEKASTGFGDDNESIVEIKNKLLNETKLIQNRQSLQELDFTYLNI
ncbi:hypothetical protein BCR36DRAFT_580159 [Piromyces finnis]|uniref:Uncharacterized protein n=1 Tax=Piromyces finnis TaxID=1754191 RepID=A0A1Y1VKY4_9FUNG|nr:hypothetical protein BCR36DRAFT_580159 [Piromyces finnis]|eukprot:ORX58546.1 hypothetical protein BCR36DRAFT_580159 [Piromyces finnis]